MRSELSTSTGISTEESAGIAVVTIGRPHVNAIDAATSHALFTELSALDERADVRAIIITGAGDRYFSAGWDLKAAAAGEAHDADHGAGGFAGLTEFFDITTPVIAAVNGAAYGGGVELLLASHLAVVSAQALFAFPEAGLGILPDAGGLNRLPAQLPRRIALELLLTGRRFTAEEAHTWGLVNTVVPPEQVLPAAMDLARSIVKAAPLSVKAILQAVSATQGTTDREGFALIRNELPTVTNIADTEDAHEGARAFTEKRAPQWMGR